MSQKRSNLQTWLVLAALIVGLFLVIMLHLLPKTAEGYRGIYAPADSITFRGVVMDTSGTVGATPSAFEVYFYKGGVLFDSTTTVVYSRPGHWQVRRLASDGSTYGDYQAIVDLTIQGYRILASDCWQVDSLGTYGGSLKNIDTAISGGVPVLAADEATIALAAADSVWGHVTRTLTSSGSGISGAEMKAIADSVILYRIGAALDSGVYDTTLGGRIYDLDVQNATGTWAAITQADCDTVKLAGTPLADAHIIVTLSSDTSTPVYWGKSDGSGCFQVYVRKGATYKVRPVYQGTWLASWCEVTK